MNKTHRIVNDGFCVYVESNDLDGGEKEKWTFQ